MSLAVSSGGWIVVIVSLVLFVAVAYGFFSRTGSGIESHPRGRRRGSSAPGAEGHGEFSGRDPVEGRRAGRGGTSA